MHSLIAAPLLLAVSVALFTKAPGVPESSVESGKALRGSQEGKIEARTGENNFHFFRDLQDHLFELTNDERRRRGVALLLPDRNLDRIAEGHSQDMLERRFIGHVNPDQEGVLDRLTRGHRRLIGHSSGENIWIGTGFDRDLRALAPRVLESLMGSPEHRRNILDSSFSHLGIGGASSGKKIRITQLFAGVKTYLARDLPTTVQRNTFISLHTESLNGEIKLAEFRPASGGPSVQGPGQTNLRMKVLVPPGVYRLTLYFPSELKGQFRGFFGPVFRVE